MPRPKSDLPDLTPEQWAMVEEAAARIPQVLAKRRIHPRYHDELQLAMLEGLMRAARRWRPDGGASWRSYAWKRMAFEVLTHQRNRYPRGQGGRFTARRVALDLAIRSGWPDLDATDHAHEIRERQDHARLAARRVLSLLPERIRAIVSRVWIDGEPVKAVAADLGKSKQAIYQALYRAKQVARDRAQEDPILRDAAA